MSVISTSDSVVGTEFQYPLLPKKLYSVPPDSNTARCKFLFYVKASNQ